MRVRYVPCVLLLACATALAAPPEPPSPKSPTAPVIELPPGPTPAAPKPVPGARQKLAAGVVYDVRAKVPVVIRAYPAGLVTITKTEVPAGETLRDNDTFSDGAKQHVYKGPVTVYAVRAVGTGAVELVVTPLGLKAEAEIVTVALDVDDGTKPQPPPKPDPKPEPIPDPKPVPVAFTWAVVVEESSARTPATAAVLSDLPMWKRIEAKGVKYRIYDVDSPDAKAKNYDVLARPIGLPAVLCLDNAGKVAKSFKLPATGAELEALVTGGSK